MKKLIGLFLFVALTLPVFAETEINEAVFSLDVVDRNPAQPLSGGDVCEESGKPVVVDTESVSKIYLWSRVKNDEEQTLVHSWQQKVDGSWKEKANVGLRVGSSVSWRTWSSKTLDPYFHKGDWRVVVSPKKIPENILCTANFVVK